MTANAFATDTNLPSFMHTPPHAKTRLSSLLTWLMGDAPANAAQDPRVNEPTVLKPDDVLVEPPQPPDDGCFQECFLNALTEATTLFAKRHVAFLHAEDPSVVYEVREVKIHCQGAPAQFLRELVGLDQVVRNSVIKKRMIKAAGAKELLTLDGCYGSTLVSDITMIDSPAQAVLVSYSGCRFVLKFGFEGSHINRPAPATVPVAAPITPPATPPTLPAQAQADAAPAPEPDGYPIVRTRLRSDIPADTSHGTVDKTKLRTDPTPTTHPIATLRLRSLDTEFSMPLLESDFPCTIGRHASFKGYSVCSHTAEKTPQQLLEAPQLLLEAEPAHIPNFVSRGHMVLHGYDSHTRQFRVVTVKGKNDSYFKNAPANGPFLLPVADMEKGHWLKLGGNSGDGILEVKLEAV